MIKKSFFFVPFFLICSLFISFFLELDSAGGSQEDFISSWKYISDLNHDLSILNTQEQYPSPTSGYSLHFPLHYLIISRLNFFLENQDFFLRTFFLISLFIPVVFYKCLVLKFENIEKEKLVLLACLIYLFPSYRSSAIWGNVHITGLFFLLFSFFYYLKWNQNKENSLNINILLQVIFLALAAYTRQYYVLLFPFFFIKYLKFLSIKNFLYLSFFTFLLSLPGIYLLTINNYLFTGLVQDRTNFFSSILVTSSIMAFYLIPFIIILFFSNIDFVKKKFFNKKSILYLFISIVIVLLFSNFFLYKDNIGGGIFLKSSRYIFNNEIFFYFTSIIGLFFLLSMINNKIENFCLILLLLLSFSTGIYIFHKYFEPMFLIILFCLFDKEITQNFLKNKILLVYVYFIVYLFVAIIQSKYHLI